MLPYFLHIFAELNKPYENSPVPAACMHSSTGTAQEGREAMMCMQRQQRGTHKHKHKHDCTSTPPNKSSITSFLFISTVRAARCDCGLV
jgi:hypothetical protein